MAYQADAMVNYDPVDKTVLANEQVDANGFSWRSGAKVEKKMLRQWFFKISEFRQQLLDDLEHLAKDNAWPERVLTMQRNWLGRSVGGRIKFSTSISEGHEIEDIEVFTTRPDTLFGVQYLALSSTHPLVQRLATDDAELREVLEKFSSFPEDSKFGHKLEGIHALNPLASEADVPKSTSASIPIYVAPYVLGDYGGGAVMGVPGHDARDHAFWKENCPDRPIQSVIAPPSPSAAKFLGEFMLVTGKGILTSNNGSFSGLTSEEATTKILSLLSSHNKGSASETWRLRDWLVSRQRYWGAPIPIIHCDSCGPVPVPASDLPVELPKGSIDWTKSNGAELFADPSWLNVPCPSCGQDARRETDTMDTFVDSSWYFMRFPDPKNEEQPFSAESANSNVPVDLYIGGVEHAILHLLYARFIAKFLSTTHLWPFGSSPSIRGEPFRKVLTQGMVHGKTYSDPTTGKFLKPDEVDLSTPSRPIVIATGEQARVSYEKMSKSKYNGVDPTECVEKHGADVTRAHMLFQAPVSDVLEWDEEKISGVRRWFLKVFEMVENAKTLSSNSEIGRNQEGGKEKTPYELLTTTKVEDSKQLEADKALWRQVQLTIESVTESYSKTFALNTVVSDLMTLTNAIQDHQAKLVSSPPPSSTSQIISQQSLEPLLKLLAPIAPAVCEELWETLHSTSRTPSSATDTSSIPSIHLLPFPTPDNSLPHLAPKTQTCAIQVNGKLRHTVKIPLIDEALNGKDLEKWIVEEILKDGEARGKFVEGKTDIRKAKKIIVVGGGRVVNFVVR